MVHYWWLVKRDTTQPLIYALILAVLLGIRAWWREQERRRQLADGAGFGSRMFKPRGKVIPINPR